MVPEEVPLKEEVLYMITPGASAGSSGDMVGGQIGKNALVVFCIDTSGSMGTTTEVRMGITKVLSKGPTIILLCVTLCRFLESFS